MPVGRGHTDIDHILVGPPRVITINTKNHNPRLRVEITPEAMTVGGRRTSNVAAARHEADRARAALQAGARDLLAVAEDTGAGAGRDRMALGVWSAVAAGHRPEVGPRAVAAGHPGRRGHRPAAA